MKRELVLKLFIWFYETHAHDIRNSVSLDIIRSES